MKKIILISLMLFCFASIGFCEEEGYRIENGVEISPGMELKTVGNTQLLIPKGSRLRYINDVLAVETAEEYSARNFVRVDKELTVLKKNQEILKNEIEELKTVFENKEEVVEEVIIQEETTEGGVE